MLVEGSGACPERRSVDPLSLKTLYALHRTEVENAFSYLGSDAAKLKQLTLPPVKDYHNWNTPKRAYADISNAENIVFVFAHSSGDYLYFSDSSVDCNTFRLHLHKDRSEAILYC
jgi:hypothetical protein